MLLNDDAIARYWNDRHRAQPRFRSGGDIGRSEQENRLFYALRFGQLVGHIGLFASPDFPLYILDAGCGNGYFADGLALAGHRVVGVDRSEAAIAAAGEGSSDVTYVVGDLETFGWHHAFDVIYAIDVMFHILDDDKWRHTALNLVTQLRHGGRLIITDTLGQQAEVAGDYIRYRPAAWYVDLLDACGFRYSGVDPYRIESTRLGFHVFNLEFALTPYRTIDAPV